MKRVGAIVAAIVVTAGIVLPTTVAQAAGTPQLSVSIKPVDAAGNDQFTAGGAIGTLNYSVSYSCNVADCDNATVVLSAAPTDPNYNNYSFLTYSSWTAPVGGGTISPGSGTGAQTIALGNVAVGTTGSFLVAYNWSVTGGGVKPASFFPNGFQILKTATGSATLATPIVATSAVTWQSTVPTPSLALSGGTTNSDTDFIYTVDMASNCLTVQGGVPAGNAREVCAKDYDVVFNLPAQAVYESSDNGGLYDPVARTVTWSQTPQVGNDPAVGWANPGNASLYVAHDVKVTFPAAAFSPSGTDSSYCGFSQNVSSSVNLTMTYLGLTPADDSNVKTASVTQNTVVQCVSPFAKGIFNSKASTFTGPARLVSNTVSPVIVQPAANPSSYYWQLSVGNQSNVPGVAVITDNPLSVNGTEVNRIDPLTSGGVLEPTATVDWVRNDGTTGTSTGSVVAPAGTWFTSAVVHSAPLAAANTLSTGTNQTTFIARFYYTVNADAPVGTRVTNTASAVMQYPNTTLPDLSLGTQSGTLEYEAPFGRGLATKLAALAPSTTVVGGVDTVTVPTTGSVNAGWQLTAYNTGNVPGVAVIKDPNLLVGPAKVTSITATASGSTAGALADVTLNTGATVTGKSLPYTAPSGNWITDVTVTSPPILPTNALTNQNDQTSYFRIVLTFAVPSTTAVDVDWTNIAAVSMTYPGMGVATVDLGSPSHLIHFQATTVAPPPPVLPRIVAQLVTSATPEGGGNAIPGRNVDYAFDGSTANVPAGPFTPEYIFIAPPNWAVTPGSANFPSNDEPAGAIYTYRTATISGVARSVVIVTWPAGTTFGAGGTTAVVTPQLDVSAQPTFAAVPGTSGAGIAWFGDSANNWTTSQASYAGAVTDTNDIDNDGLTNDGFSQVSMGTVTVGSASQLSVVKQICEPDPSASDGCDWVSDPSQVVGVDPDANDIGYRIQLTNSGNTSLTNLVAYDVLPYLGDTGTSAATAGTPRNSTFAETLSSISGISGATVSYSDSTNPCRPEVYPAAPGCSADWTASAAGAAALRITGTGSLAPGATATVTYLATVAPGAAPDSIACNSVAASVTQIGTPTEPQAVCAGVKESDLQLTVPSHLPLQSGRPGVVPYLVTNLAGGSAAAPATVSIDIPAGLTVTSLIPAGWSCAAPPLSPIPLVGPVTIDCSAVNSDGSPRLLVAGVPDPLNLAVVPTLMAGSITVEGTASGSYFDPDSTNNDASGVFDIDAGLAQIGLTKTDGVASTSGGQTLTYTLQATNLLVGEALPGAVITDTLPAGETFVSATGGGMATAGTVTWNLAALTQAGVPNGNGDGDSGNPGSSATVSVTVKVAANVTSDITNTAEVSAPDPADSSSQLSANDSDTDSVRAVTIKKTSDVPAIGVTVGDTVTYTVTEKNVGDAAYTVDNPATIADDLSGVLNESSFVGGSAKVKIDGGAATSVADPTAGVLTWSGALSSGSTAVLTYEVKATSGASPLVNTAYSAAPSSCSAGVDANGFPCASTSDAFAPVLSIVKTATLNDANGNGTADAGETISYSFLVTNTGGTTAANVAVVDPKVTGLAPVSASIAAGASATFTASSYTVTQADVDAGGVITNTAKATGTDATGDALPASPNSTATVNVTAAAPGLLIVKTATLHDTNANGTADAGEKVSYSFVVTNTGNVTETGVRVTDPRVTGIAPAPVTLAPGASQTFTATDYTVTQANIDAQTAITNTATATGKAPSGSTTTSLPSTVSTMVTAASTGLTIVKTATLHDSNGNGTADAGEKISYSFLVTNTGNETETGVTVVDAKVTGIAPAPVTLAPGASQTFTATDYTVTQADVDAQTAITNTAKATATSPSDDIVTSPNSTATTDVTVAVPSLTIVKTAVLGDTNRNGTADAGETISYSFLVTNAGNGTETNVTVTDPNVTGIAPASVTLAPGASQTFTAADYTVTQADIDAQTDISNTASATGKSPSGGTVTSPTSTATTPVTAEVSGLTIVKAASLNDANGNGTADAGETISYTFLVTNTGNVTDSSVSVMDSKVTGIAPAMAVLAPGAHTTFTATDYTVTQADVDAQTDIVNTATAAGVDPAGAAVNALPASASTPVTVESASLSIVKSGVLADTNGNGRVDVGESVAYSFVVTNTGNVTLHDVTVDDAMVTGIAPAPVTLAPGQQQVFTADPYIGLQADIDQGGAVSNTATAIGTDPAGTVVPPSAPSTVQTPLANPAPQLTIVKTGALQDGNGNGKADAGEKISYSFVVTNTGNVTETGVTVDDAMVTGISPAPVTLLPGQVQAFTSDAYTVRAVDVQHGSVMNTATATGTAPHVAPTVSVASTVVTPTGPVPLPPLVRAALAFTGDNPTPFIGLAVSLLVVGGIILAFGYRRRRRAAHR